MGRNPRSRTVRIKAEKQVNMRNNFVTTVFMDGEFLEFEASIALVAAGSTLVGIDTEEMILRLEFILRGFLSSGIYPQQ